MYCGNEKKKKQNTEKNIAQTDNLRPKFVTLRAAVCVCICVKKKKKKTGDCRTPAKGL